MLRYNEKIQQTDVRKDLRQKLMKKQLLVKFVCLFFTSICLKSLLPASRITSSCTDFFVMLSLFCYNAFRLIARNSIFITVSLKFQDSLTTKRSCIILIDSKSNDYSFSPDYLRQLQTKIAHEHSKAQLALKAGNRSEAQLCLTKRKLMENEVRRLTLPSVSCVKERDVKCEVESMKFRTRSVKNASTGKNSSYL